MTPTPMDQPPPRGDAAAAGVMLLLAIVLCALAGFGIGAAVGAKAILAVAGGAVGLVLGFILVYTRFKNI